mmetsp:Transcript_18594/g.51693  ORF Transcript_18594/g.51693 Transcript_18594/m.51693 type:complete len:176 (-) Transcript_18594:1134-1661(-)
MHLFYRLKPIIHSSTVSNGDVLACSHFHTYIHMHALCNDLAFVCDRHRVPPRSLLTLAGADTADRKVVLEKAASISMFKAPSSWSMAGLTFLSGRLDGDVIVPTSETKLVRAKLASGVPCIMGTVQQPRKICNAPIWGSRRHVHKKQRSIWEMYLRILFTKLGLRSKNQRQVAAA